MLDSWLATRTVGRTATDIRVRLNIPMHWRWLWPNVLIVVCNGEIRVSRRVFAARYTNWMICLISARFSTCWLALCIVLVHAVHVRSTLSQVSVYFRENISTMFMKLHEIGSSSAIDVLNSSEKNENPRVHASEHVIECSTRSNQNMTKNILWFR